MIGPLSRGQAFLTECDFGYTPTQAAVRLLASDGSIAVARSTSGIVNMGGAKRAKLVTPPSVDGWYLPVWDDNSVDVAVDEAVWVSNILADTLTAAVAAGGGGISAAPIVLPAGGVSPVVTQTFFIKRGDNEPLIFQVTEVDAANVPRVRDVTGWTGHFKLRAAADTGTIIINQPFYLSTTAGAVTTDGTGGLLAYNWPNTGETDREGLFVAEFECTRDDGSKKTYPTTSDVNNEYIKVYFVPDLDDAGSH